MSLEKWAEYGWIKAEPSSPEEIRGLISIVTRALSDANVQAISDDLRFQAAFSAGLTSANIALRASGYRTRVQAGHHQKIVESLELTLHADSKVIQKLKVFSKKRNATAYDSAGSVSGQELEQAIKVAHELLNEVNAWLARTHPELIENA
jgi:hypothetical protein